MNIIHFSDTHFELDKNGQLSYEKEQLYDALVNDLKDNQYVDPDSIMVITGDLVDKGGMDFNDQNPFEKFKELFIDKIKETFPLLQKRIFIIPGNHDIVRDKIDDIIYKGIIQTYKENYNKGDDFIKKNKNNYEKLKYLESYKNFEKDFYKDYNDVKINNFQTTAIVTMNNPTLGIACFNSVWLCSKNGEDDYGNLILGKSQIEQALKDIKDTGFKIALFHHPIEFFMKEDRENIEPLLFKNFNVILNGHSHKIESGYYQTLKGNTFISVSPAILGNKETDTRFSTGYTIIKFDTNRYVVYYRKYLWDHNKFVLNTDIGNDKGEKTFIISEEQQQIDDEINKALTYIKNTHIDKANNDLIIYNAEEGLPNSIEEVFVNPTIGNVTESQAQNEKIEKEIKYYSLEEIILSHENFLIYGKKETGKTILLDDFLIELTKNYKKYKKVPVLIKFQDIKNRDIETCMKQFLSLSTRMKLKDLYDSGIKFILLIDDLSFSDLQKYKLNKLIEFKKMYPNMQIIATSLHKVESMIPEDHLEYNQYFNFNVVYIHGLKTSQIKSLIKRWFKNKDLDFQSNIERLIKSFQELGLPRTPLSLTMLLWIIQKQEKRPINSAVLVEIFIENLLEKANFENVYSETFDFYNKKRLLAFLSYYMLRNGDAQESYAIQYSQALDYMRGYLKGKTGDPKIILDNLIDRGIFVLVDGTIRFKFAFYFHFFLAVYMEFEEKFREEVLENVVEYKDELEYYTGLNRDKKEILDIVLEKLKFTYRELNNFIFEKSVENIVDKILETKEPLSNYIDLEKIKEKPTDKDLEETYDNKLQQLPVKRDVRPKQLLSKENRYRLGEILELSAHLLKNLEEIGFDTKVDAYRKILKSSISFLLLYKQYLLENYKKLKDSSFLPKGIDFYIFISLLPILHQVVLYDWIGTIKLKEIIEDKIKKDNENNDISEFEKFLSVFIYSDIKAPNYQKIVKNFYKNSKSKYILDSIFFKLLSYYFLRSKDKETDKFYLDILADVKVKLKQIDKAKKSQFINKLEENKSSYLTRKDKQDDEI
jgi:predicted MPP superfamily phosphohydrolase/KaiC/GvpD/RAD55 family RecA-like ATPase